MSDVSRDAPCPCGSGRKYKRCCYAEDRARAEPPPPTGTGDDLDMRLAVRVASWVASRDARVHERAEDCLGAATRNLPGGEGTSLQVNLMAYDSVAPEGDRWVERFRSREAHRLDPAERRYLDAEVASWFSVHTVRSVQPGVGFVLVDQLTGQSHDVRERSASAQARPQDALFARVVRRDLADTLGSVSPFMLPPREAEAVLEAFRRERKLGAGPVDPALLRGEAAFVLARLWAEALQARQSRPAPALVDAEGQPVKAIVDLFTFAAARHADVKAALERAPGINALPQEAGESGQPFAVDPSALPGRQGEADLAPHLVLLDERIELLCFDRALADAVVEHVERALRGLAQRAPREELTPGDLVGRGLAVTSGAGGALPDESPEMQAAVREHLEGYYEGWLDEALPALGGRTPREVARKPGTKAYRELETILRDIEHTESGNAPARRYDVGILRRALGMEDSRGTR